MAAASPATASPAHVVDNAGSTARDHLANERTFLAWIRTALGLVGLGIVVGKLVEAGPLARLGGVVLVGAGGVFLLYSVLRYRRVASYLERRQFPIAVRGPLLLGIGCVALAGASLAFLLW